jgi:hypothetical protein
MAGIKMKISTAELIKRVNAARKKPISSGFEEKFNRIVEKDDRQEPTVSEKRGKKIARAPEVEG